MTHLHATDSSVRAAVELEPPRSAEDSRSASPASPRPYAAEAGRLVDGFLVQIFPRQRSTADRAEVDGVEAMATGASRFSFRRGSVLLLKESHNEARRG